MSTSKWSNRKAANYFTSVEKARRTSAAERARFGELVYVANVRHGEARWKSRGLFVQHVLKDEKVKHSCPKKHVDYFYSTVKFFVPAHRIENIQKISGSLFYDQLKKEITARCSNIKPNIATLFLAMKVASGESRIADVKKNNLYKSHIMGKAMTHKQMEKEMRRMKRQNHKKYRLELKKAYGALAYPKGC